MHLLLGSQSPRRQEILSFFSLPFQAVSSNFDEDSIPFSGNAIQYVKQLSECKADALAKSYENTPILTADTIVYKDGKVYGKPKCEQESKQTLKELSGQWHSVYTGICLASQGHKHFKVEETRVLFNPLTEDLISKYHNSLHLYDKAGSYQIQTAGGIIVRKIDGCYYNVLGLPINAVRQVLHEIGIELWDYIKK